jgi:hypothetical protein
MRLIHALPLALTSLTPLFANTAAPGQPEARFELRGPAFVLEGDGPSIAILEGDTKTPHTLAPAAATAEAPAARTTPLGSGTATTFRWEDPRGYRGTWTLTRLADSPAVSVQMTFENRTKQPVILREFVVARLRFAPATEPARWWVSTVDSHNYPDGGFLPAADLATSGTRLYIDAMTVYTDRGAQGVLAGAVGPAEADVRFRATVADGKLAGAAVSDMTDIVVDPGETRRSEEVLFTAAPHDPALDGLLRWIAATHGTRTKRGPIVGWCSWYDRGKKIDAQHILGVTEAVAKHRDRIPLQVIQIDDGWQVAYGDWRIDRAKFPEGLEPIAAKIKEAGAIPGIWLCPIRTSGSGAHPDGRTEDYLDPTHPGVQAFVREMLAARLAEGFRYFKLDFNSIRSGTRYDRKKTRLQAHRDLFKLYRECLGEETYLLACVGGLTRGPIGYADAQRIGTDSTPKWGPLYLGCTILDCIFATGAAAPSNGLLSAADPDVTYTLPRRELGPAELRTWHGFVGLLGGLMLVSEPLNDPRYQSAESLRMLEILIPPAPDKGRSFEGGTDPAHRRFGFVAKRPWGNFAAVQIWNPADAPADIPLDDLPAPGLGERFHAWSFWDRQYLGLVDRSFAAKALPPRGPALLRLTAAGDGPTLVGSDLHIAMGSAEIAAIRREGATLAVELTDAGAREGTLVFHSPQPLALARAEGCAAAVAPAGKDLWSIAISSRERKTPQRILLNIRP